MWIQDEPLLGNKEAARRAKNVAKKVKKAARKAAKKEEGIADGAAAASTSRQQAGGGLRPPWEEHWSEKYHLTYFWNSKTGESSWERP
eukprot:13800355-Alexandrium_andersonii.AAC.1